MSGSTYRSTRIILLFCYPRQSTDTEFLPTEIVFLLCKAHHLHFSCFLRQFQFVFGVCLLQHIMIPYIWCSVTSLNIHLYGVNWYLLEKNVCICMFTALWNMTAEQLLFITPSSLNDVVFFLLNK